MTTLGKRSSESIEAFRSRVRNDIAAIAYDDAIVEAPETLACSRYLAGDYKLHVRLHGSRDLGARIQGLPVDAATQSLEAREIDRAWRVSAPSRAAVAAAHLSYAFSRRISVFPNPVPNPPSTVESGQRDLDVLFLGRWQSLKGTAFIETLVDQLQHLRFGIASDQVPANVASRCEILMADTDNARTRALRRARIVLVPSLFETASMVGLEAFAHARPVVTWAHLGLAEYAEPPWVQAVEPFDVPAMKRSIELALSTADILAHCPAVGDLNWRFDRSAQAIANGATCMDTDDRSHRTSLRTTKILTNMISAADTNRHHILKRKAKKLIRDPGAFWRDSALNRALGTTSEGVFPGRTLIKRPSSTDQRIPVSDARGHYPGQRVLGTIESAGYIKVKEISDRLPSHSTGIVHHTSDQPRVARLIGELDQFRDFSPLQSDNLSLLQYEDLADTTVASIVSRIDQANKQRIGTIANLIFFDPPPQLVSALKACSPNIKAVVVVTNDGATPVNVDAQTTDVLVVPEHHRLIQQATWRKVVASKTYAQLPIALRRVIQEVAPKSPDLLLPLVNANQYQPELIEFNTANYQGVIKLRQPVARGRRTFAALCEATADCIETMLVAESVYLRYRTQCEVVESGGSAAALLQFCLADGVLFDVR
ncbi:MAG: glycosyltransferase [Burkholderiaceae bacterium]